MSADVSIFPLSTIGDQLHDAGLTGGDRLRIYEATYPMAKLAGVVWSGSSDPHPWKWLAQDHPTRVNLLLETLGYEVRL